MGLLRKLVRKLREPRCHLQADEKAWVERRMLWLNSQFGSRPIRRAPLEPGSKFLPGRWDGSYEAGQDLFERMCDFMLLDPKRLHLEFYLKSESHEVGSDYAGETHSSGPAGLYHQPENGERLVIGLEESALLQPASLAATICHELGHVHLLADARIRRDEQDCEPLTDLLTVYFGAGMLTANSAFQFNQWQDGNMQGWSVSRHGYLTEALFGYSLACFSWYRGDLEPCWGKHLRDNISYYFDDSMHFLSTTRDTSVPFNGA